MEDFIEEPERDMPNKGRSGCRHSAVKVAIGTVIVGAIGTAFAVAFFWATQADAHDAPASRMQPTGWSYGWECCSATDCSQSQDNDIAETQSGYVVRRTGEVIAYGDSRIKRSKDEFFHRCTPGGNADALRSICLYVPDRAF